MRTGARDGEALLSYSRKDEAKARRFTDWLEREGHDVWRDEEDIGGGASFSLEIERALKGSEAVLVLWSADSVQSAWVRDEAGYGRDAGKLIPFLDGTEPPLGFRQFQSISLSRWKGIVSLRTPERIRQAIARVADFHTPSLRSASCGKAVTRPNRFAKSLLVGAADRCSRRCSARFFPVAALVERREIAIADAAVAAIFRPSDGYGLCDRAAADMAAFLPRRFDRATVIAPDEASGAASGYQC